MFAERIIRLVKCLAAAGCGMYMLNALEADASANTVVFSLIGYAALTMWTYFEFPKFALCYTYLWEWCSIMGILGYGFALVLMLALTIALLAAGVAILPIIFICTLFALFIGED